MCVCVHVCVIRVDDCCVNLKRAMQQPAPWRIISLSTLITISHLIDHLYCAHDLAFTICDRNTDHAARMVALLSINLFVEPLVLVAILMRMKLCW